MKSFTFVAIAAGLASISNAYYSRYWKNWDEVIAEVNCQNGPVACGQDDSGADEFCMRGYVCGNHPIFGIQCDDVARYQCKLTCDPGTTLHPLRYCECISFEERNAMFCAAEPATDTGD